MLRLLLYPRNVACFASPVNGVKWASVITTVASLTFAFAEAFVCLGFTYAQLGVVLFGGDIPKKGYIPELDLSPFGENDFYVLNFNDMTSAFFTLFCCLRMYVHEANLEKCISYIIIITFCSERFIY